MAIQALIRRLSPTANALEFWDANDKLQRHAKHQRVAVLEAFLGYMQSRSIDHLRSHAASQSAQLVAEGEAEYAAAFESGLAEKSTAYWSILGLLKCLGKASYPILSAFALDPSNETEPRAYAVKLLAERSGQTFIGGLPSDPGHWSLNQLPLGPLKRWITEGYPDGAGFGTPAVSPQLADPKTEIDRLAAKLERKLKRYRAIKQDPSNPTNWLIPGDQQALREVSARWILPAIYLEFLSKFSPLQVTVERLIGNDLRLYGAAELVEAQHGYAWDPNHACAILDWNSNHVVIASEGGDPFVLDLAAVQSGDCPVLTALHGTGHWRFKPAAPTFAKFLKRLS